MSYLVITLVAYVCRLAGREARQRHGRDEAKRTGSDAKVNPHERSAGMNSTPTTP